MTAAAQPLLMPRQRASTTVATAAAAPWWATDATTPMGADTVLPLRACVLCTHGTDDLAGTRVCRCPDLVGRGAPVPVGPLRRRHGPCGPEAMFMAAPWLATD